LLAAVGSPLLATGLAGLYVLLAQQPEKPRLIKGPAITGLVLAGFATWLPLIIMLQLSTAGQILVPLQPFFGGSLAVWSCGAYLLLPSRYRHATLGRAGVLEAKASEPRLV
jgi:hypothetical protein